MSEITQAIAAKQTQIAQLQSDIETLQRAASVLGKKGPTAKATSQPKPKQKRRGMSAAARKAVSQRMKAYWAKRKRAGRAKK